MLQEAETGTQVRGGVPKLHVPVEGPYNKSHYILGARRIETETAPSRPAMTMIVPKICFWIWVVVKSMVPFWVPEILGAVL